MKFAFGLIAGAVVASGLVGCGKKEYVPEPPKAVAKEYKIDPENPGNIFPFVEGNIWTYNMDINRVVEGQPNSTGVAELEYRVKSVSKNGKSVKATLELYQNGERKDEQEWQSDAGGLYQLSLGSGDKKRVFSPPQLIVKFPIKTDEQSTWKGYGPVPTGTNGDLSYTFKTGELQNLDTDIANESMRGLFVESLGTFKSDKIEGIIATNSWFVPGVGLARYKQVIQVKGGKSEITLRLKSYTVK